MADKMEMTKQLCRFCGAEIEIPDTREFVFHPVPQCTAYRLCTTAEFIHLHQPEFLVDKLKRLEVPNEKNGNSV